MIRISKVLFCKMYALKMIQAHMPCMFKNVRYLIRNNFIIDVVQTRLTEISNIPTANRNAPTLGMVLLSTARKSPDTARRCFSSTVGFHR